MPHVFPIILASTSPARLELFRNAGIACTGVAPGVNESRLQHAEPTALATLRATAKARAVDVAGACVIGADQVAWMEGDVFGKPHDADDHRARLRLLRGRTHTLTTATVIRYGGSEHRLLVETRIRFRADLSDEEIDAYVACGEGSGCAGGYAAEGWGGQLIASIDGDFFNVLGLPLLEVITTLRNFGWRSAFPGSLP